MVPTARRAFILFVLVVLPFGHALASDRSGIREILHVLRSVSSGKSVPGGLRPVLAPSLIGNPRLALPGMNDTEFARRMGWYAPFAGSAEDRAAAAMGIWVAFNAETIAAAPVQRTSAAGVSLDWPGSRLFLERVSDGFRIAGSGETAAQPPPVAIPPPYRRLTLLLTNDIHGYLLPYPASWSKGETRAMLGAMASVATYVKRCRAVAAALDEPLFLFDAGDLYQGTPEGTLSKGSSMVPVMNALGYDAIAVGNHEYDHGRSNAERIFAGLRAPVLGANVWDSGAGKVEKGLHRLLFLERGGVRIGLTGILTPNMPSLTFEKNIRGLDFRPPLRTVMEVLPELRARNPNLVVLLSHVGFQDDKSMADFAAGIDVILGGHSHTAVDTAWVGKNRTVVVQTPGKASNIGRLDVLVSPAGGVDTFVWQLVPLHAKSFPEDAAMKELIRRATRRVNAEMARVIGRSDTEIDYAYRRESAMGRLTTDILKSWANADIAILAGGGMRAGFLQGPVTVRDCFQVFPFGNPLAVAGVSGEVLRRVLEHGVSTDRGRIQISGAAILADTYLAPGSRLIDVQIGGAAFDRTRTYRVVTDGFLAQGGSGYFSGESIPWEIHTDRTPFDLLRDYVERTGLVQPPPAERIRYREKEKGDGSNLSR